MVKYLLIVLGFSLSTSALAQNYSITWKKGSSQIQTMDGGKVLVPMKLPLRQSFRIQTRTNTDLLLVDGKENILYIAPDSDVSLLVPDDNSAPMIVRIHSGEIYLHLDAATKPLKISTPFGDWSLASGMLDIKYDEPKASLEIKNYEGKTDLKINDAEDGIILHDNQRVGFTGEKNEEGLVFNFLLAGKKVAQGKWGKIQPLTKKDLKTRQTFWTQLVAVQKQIIQKQKQEEKINESKYLCSKPSGQLGQCVWTCKNNPKSEKKVCRVNIENVSCIRRRCFADGEWKESITLDRGEASLRCKAQPIVAACQ